MDSTEIFRFLIIAHAALGGLSLLSGFLQPLQIKAANRISSVDGYFTTHLAVLFYYL